MINTCYSFFGPQEDKPENDLKPVPFILRTPKYLYLETSTIGNDEILQNIYSPFGCIKLLNSSTTNISKSVSRTFLKLMQGNWEIEEVTDRVEFYEFSNKNEDSTEKINKPSDKLPFLEKGLAIPHIYLIKTLNKYNFIKEEDINSQYLTIYTISYLNVKQSQNDNYLFSKLKSIKELNEF